MQHTTFGNILHCTLLLVYTMQYILACSFIAIIHLPILYVQISILSTIFFTICSVQNVCRNIIGAVCNQSSMHEILHPSIMQCVHAMQHTTVGNILHCNLLLVYTMQYILACSFIAIIHLPILYVQISILSTIFDHIQCAKCLEI